MYSQGSEPYAHKVLVRVPLARELKGSETFGNVNNVTGFCKVCALTTQYKKWDVLGWKHKIKLFLGRAIAFSFWRRKWQPIPVFLPGESQGWGGLVGCHLWGHTELGMTEVMQQQQQHSFSWQLDASIHH